MRPEHIAIVGCGFAGTSAFFQLVDRHPVKRITIFEASGTFGPGYPYQLDECADYLLNNTTDSLCLVPSNRRAFLDWARRQPQYGPQVDEKGHLPRRVFGAFLQDVFEATRTVAAIKGIEVVLVAEEATGLAERADGCVAIHSVSGEIIADAALLTLGRSPAGDHLPHPPAGSAARYIANHIRNTALDGVPLDAHVHVLGASLSAYDVVNRLFSSDTGCRFERRAGELVFVPGANGRHVTLCSRGGRPKSVQSRHPIKLERRHFTPVTLSPDGKGGLSLERIARAIQAEAAAHGIEIDWGRVRDPYAGCETPGQVNARAGELLADAIVRATDPRARNFLVDFFGNAQLDIWAMFASQWLSPADERKYRDRYETATLTVAAPSALPTMERLLALHRAGRLSIVKGAGAVTLAADGSAYAIAHEHGSERATTLINTMGSVDRDVVSTRQPALIRDLVRQGLLQSHARDGVAMKGAAIDMAAFRLPATRRVHYVGMLLWGPGFFTSSAFLMATFVERALEAMFGEG